MTDAPRGRDDQRDFELIARWKGGGRACGDRVVERHASALARFAVSLGERAEVDELVQDTFVRAFGSLDGFRGDASFRTWLFTIQRRLLVDRRRSERRKRDAGELHDHDAATEFDALDALVADETATRLQKVMGRLSPTQREVFVLRVAEGLSYKEIAEAADTTEGAARVHYHNAMRVVKEFLNE